jgi:hypothetical protein
MLGNFMSLTFEPSAPVLFGRKPDIPSLRNGFKVNPNSNPRLTAPQIKKLSLYKKKNDPNAALAVGKRMDDTSNTLTDSIKISKSQKPFIFNEISKKPNAATKNY